jgi:hypothetical protein
LRSALNTGKTTDRIDTIGEALAYMFNSVLPYTQPTVDYLQQKYNNNELIFVDSNGSALDLNMSEALNPNVVSGMFFVKFDGLKVTNFNDYLSNYPDLETISPNLLRRYLISEKAYLPKKDTLVTVYGNNLKPTSVKVSSPLVINEDSITSVPDSNNVNVEAKTNLKFYFVSNMYSDNYSKSMISSVPLSFSYAVPSKPIGVKELIDGINAFVNNPVGSVGSFAVKNWFLLVILVCLILVTSLVYANFNSGKGNTININNRG